MVNLTIDNKKVQAEEGSTILETARSNGVEIPTLCYHDELTASGACRLCSVEIKKGATGRGSLHHVFTRWRRALPLLLIVNG